MLKSYLYSTQKRMLCAIADGNAKQKTREKTRANDFVVPSSYTYFPTSWMCDYIAEFFLSLNVLGVICTNDVFFFFRVQQPHKEEIVLTFESVSGLVSRNETNQRIQCGCDESSKPIFLWPKTGDEKIESSLARILFCALCRQGWYRKLKKIKIIIFFL